jgi:ATP synthase subunit 6
MEFTKFIFSPLSQFEILPGIPLRFLFLDITFTNGSLIFVLVFIIISVLYCFITNYKDSTINLHLNGWQLLLLSIFNLTKGVVIDNIGSIKGSKFFPLIFSIFLYIVCFNLIGLIPYSFTTTSHIIGTFCLSFFLFFGLNIIAVRIHGYKFFSLFLPSGTSFLLAFLLIPIELISYIFKPISLSIRLFANMMAGHSLLKILIGFAFVIAFKFNTSVWPLYFLGLVPFFIVFIITFLEVAIALLQGYVFTVLMCLYIKDLYVAH